MDLAAGPVEKRIECRSSGSTANRSLLSAEVHPCVTKNCSCIRKGYSSKSNLLGFSPPICTHKVRSSFKPSVLITSSTMELKVTLTSLLGASTAKGSRPSKMRIQLGSCVGRGLKPRVEARRRRDLRRSGGDEACSPSSHTMTRTGAGGREARTLTAQCPHAGLYTRRCITIGSETWWGWETCCSVNREHRCM